MVQVHFIPVKEYSLKVKQCPYKAKHLGSNPSTLNSDKLNGKSSVLIMQL